jgi:kynurenine formamidase
MRIVDLSHPIYDGQKGYFPLPKVVFWPFTHHEVTKKLYQDSSSATMALFLSDHAGTHIDAPLHFDPHGKDVFRLPLDSFFSPAVVLDVSHLDPKEEITEESLEDCENASLLEKGRGALIRTGWDRFWGEDRYPDHPYLTEPGAEWLLERGVSLLGIDALSMDSVHRKEKAVHNRFLREREIPTVENLCRLQEVKEGVFTFIAFPLPLVGCTGSPVRAVGILDREE